MHSSSTKCMLHALPPYPPWFSEEYKLLSFSLCNIFHSSSSSSSSSPSPPPPLGPNYFPQSNPTCPELYVVSSVCGSYMDDPRFESWSQMSGKFFHFLSVPASTYYTPKYCLKLCHYHLPLFRNYATITSQPSLNYIGITYQSSLNYASITTRP